MRNAAVTFISPGSTGLNRSLETLNLFLTPSCFSEELLYKDSQRQKTGQVGLVQAPPARPFFIVWMVWCYQRVNGLVIFFLFVYIVFVYSPYLHERNKQPKTVGREWTGRKNPRPAFHCLLFFNINIRMNTPFFYDLYRRISSPPYGYPLTKQKGSGRVPLLRAPVRADF